MVLLCWQVSQGSWDPAVLGLEYRLPLNSCKTCLISLDSLRVNVLICEVEVDRESASENRSACHARGLPGSRSWGHLCLVHGTGPALDSKLAVCCGSLH